MAKRTRIRLCQSCDRLLLKGSRRAWVLSPHGELSSGLVCKRCALRAVAMVVPPAITVAPACTMCRREPAVVGKSCVEALQANVRELTSANVALRQGALS